MSLRLVDVYRASRSIKDAEFHGLVPSQGHAQGQHDQFEQNAAEAHQIADPATTAHGRENTPLPIRAVYGWVVCSRAVSHEGSRTTPARNRGLTLQKPYGHLQTTRR